MPPPHHHRFRFFFFFSWLRFGLVGTGGGLPYPPFQGPAVAHGTPSAYLRGALRRTGRSQQRGLLPTDHNLTYGCYGQRPPLKVNELGGLQQPKKEKKALPRATAGVGERVRLLPSTHTGLRTTGSKEIQRGAASAPRTLFCSFSLPKALPEAVAVEANRQTPRPTRPDHNKQGGRGRFFSTPVFRGGRGGGAYSESEGEVVVHTVTVRGSPSPQRARPARSAREWSSPPPPPRGGGVGGSTPTLFRESPLTEGERRRVVVGLLRKRSTPRAPRRGREALRWALPVSVALTQGIPAGHLPPLEVDVSKEGRREGAARRGPVRALALSGCALAPPSTAEPPALPPQPFPWGYGQGAGSEHAGLAGWFGRLRGSASPALRHVNPTLGPNGWQAGMAGAGARGRTGHPRQQRRKREQTLHVFRERPDAGPASLQVRRTPQGGIDKGLAVGAFAEPARPGAAARPPQPTTRHQPASQTRDSRSGLPGERAGAAVEHTRSRPYCVPGGNVTTLEGRWQPSFEEGTGPPQCAFDTSMESRENCDSHQNFASCRGLPTSQASKGRRTCALRKRVAHGAKHPAHKTGLGAVAHLVGPGDPGGADKDFWVRPPPSPGGGGRRGRGAVPRAPRGWDGTKPASQPARPGDGGTTTGSPAARRGSPPVVVGAGPQPTRPRAGAARPRGPRKAAPPTAPAARTPQSLPRFRGREPERQGQTNNIRLQTPPKNATRNGALAATRAARLGSGGKQASKHKREPAGGELAKPWQGEGRYSRWPSLLFNLPHPWAPQEEGRGIAGGFFLSRRKGVHTRDLTPRYRRNVAEGRRTAGGSAVARGRPQKGGGTRKPFRTSREGRSPV
ncbi:hypothetical protein C7M84_018146 [Penaeus vannamei]|uniref:Collagen alpha-1(I) chain-like n=1 Tax=Penaeus vannamei TaxID=6689 RepID=A0A3R7LTH3_PENVA|nr:hypothetical protein C7M84_018146 [Penaeus vannamei]